MAQFQPPPTWAEVVLVDPETKQGKFNPVWLKWFVDLIEFVDAVGGVSGIVHNSTTGLQGGTANQYYHETAAEYALTQLQSAGIIRGATGVPGAGLGANGDYYFRADAGAVTHIYYKVGGAWAAIV